MAIQIKKSALLTPLVAFALSLISCHAEPPSLLNKSKNTTSRATLKLSDQQLPPFSPIIYPSAFASHANAKAKKMFYDHAQQIGAVRLSVEYLLRTSTSPKQFQQELRKIGKEWKMIEKKGGQIILTVSAMPPWLSSDKRSEKVPGGDYSYAEASPPADWQQWEKLAYSLVEHFNKELGLNILYEVWNEPNSAGFWQGSKEEFFQLYYHFATGARRADPKAKIGGPSTSGFVTNIGRSSAFQQKPLVLELIEFAGKKKVPIDFLSWHAFNIDPKCGYINEVKATRQHLRKHHFNPSIPLIIDEWALWQPGSYKDARRDTATGAAFSMATLAAMLDAGVDLQTKAALQDFHSAKGSDLFHGDFGLLTSSPIVKKPAFHILELCNHLIGKKRLPLHIEDPQLGAASNLYVLAGADSHEAIVILWNYLPDPMMILQTLLRDTQLYSSLSGENIAQRLPTGASSPVQLAQKIQKKPEMLDQWQLPAPLQAQAKIAATQLKVCQQKQSQNRTIDLRPLARKFKDYQHFQYITIDAQRNNGHYTFSTQLASGKSLQQATQAAQAQQALQPVLKGTLQQISQRLQLDQFPILVNSVHCFIFTK